MNEFADSNLESNATLSLGDRVDNLRRLIRGKSAENWMATAVIISFVFYFTIPQEIIKPLGAMRAPMLVSNFCFLLWLTRISKNWTPQTKLMVIFFLVEGFRNFIGKVVFDDLVRNDYWSIQTWKDLFLQFSGLMCPTVVFLGSGKQIRRLSKVWLLVALYLGLWVSTHHGRGPGNFMGDENDVCLVLDMFLGIPLALLVDSNAAPSRRFLYMVVSMAVFAGIAMSKSRGGFVGFALAAVYFLLFARRRVQFLILGAVLCTAAVAVAPSDYVSEIRSIQDTDKGTAADRRFFWKLATRMWLDHFWIGIGMNNTPFQLGDYAKPEELLHRPKPSGRATHSLYFELLPDLGLWGIIMVGSIVGLSVRGNYRGLQAVRDLERRISSYSQEIRRAETLELWGGQTTAPPSDELRFEEDEAPSDALLKSEAFQLLRAEIEVLGPLFLAANVSFFGVLGSGAFISTLYYPPMWFLCAWSALLFRYWSALSEEAESILDEHFEAQRPIKPVLAV